MNDDLPDSSPQPPIPSNLRLRSVPFRSPFFWAGLLTLINYCGAIAVLTMVVLFFLHQTPFAVKVLIGCVVFFAITALISHLKRRSVLCPLCKGTPLVSTRAHVHSRATRIFPFDYGNSAMISILFTQTFRCMYCGSGFDLLKPRPGHRNQNDETPSDSLKDSR